MKLASSHQQNRKGFTLIELLVVIAIIAILAAILFPVFAKVREKARQTSCLSNQKQIGLAFTQYNQDYDEHYPQSVTERYSPQGNYASPGTGSTCSSTNYVANAQEAAAFSIRGILNPYVKSNGVWHCPSQGTAWAWDGPGTYNASEDATADGLATKKAWFLTDYGFNFDEGVWADQGSGTNGYGIPIANGPSTTCVPHATDFISGALKGMGFNGTTTNAQISSPSNFILGADTKRSPTTVSRGSLTPQPALTATGGRLDFAQGAVTLDATQAALDLRHSDGANFIYADGHAKWRRPEQTWRSATDNDWLRAQ